MGSLNNATKVSKSTDHTVFVRFLPPTAQIRRHHLEEVFSEIGPIKKSSVICPKSSDTTEKVGSSYGFVRYTCRSDAEKSAKSLNDQVIQVEGDDIKLKVELASTAVQKETQSEQSEEKTISKANRLIIRNLSFFARERDVRSALENYGELVEVHIPTVGEKNQSRGFCFVTFQKSKDAEKCLEASNIVIRKRAVTVARTLNKTAYEARKKQTFETASDVDDESDSEETKSSGESDDESKDPEPDNDENSENSNASEKGEVEKPTEGTDTSAVLEKRCVFLRNLAFDVTRHDLFETFRKFGRIDSIYIVRDPVTGLPKGTAFVTYSQHRHAEKALEASRKGDGSFVSQKETEISTGQGLTLKGRPILVDWAVDKGTASAITMERSAENKASGKDRRNLYLKAEGRVDNDTSSNAWDNLPEADQQKRQRAWSEKMTKLRSPLFFINPTRLSFRNLAKSVTESDLKRLCVLGIQRGLENSLVSVEDELAQWRAKGDVTTREILQKLEATNGEHQKVIPSFDPSNIKKYVVSIFIDRDFGGGKNKSDAPSRGFAFVEFGFHAHALACLRELNNNAKYASEFVQGGFHAVQTAKKGNGKIPRLILEFTVENKTKARQQATHRAQQLANYVKQREQHRDQTQGQTKTKKSRGALQREKKRKQQQEGEPKEIEKETKDQHQEKGNAQEPEGAQQTTKPKGTKPPRKRKKVDDEEKKFSQMVDSYKLAFGKKETEDARDDATAGRKRWFE